MNNETCRFEEQVIDAIGSNDWTADLRSHAASCPVCHPTLKAASAMRRLSASLAGAEYPPVNHRALWFRAQIVRRERRLSIVDLVLFLSSLGVALAGLVAIVLWNWDSLCALLGGISPASGSQLSLLIVAGGAALLWVLTEELFFSDK